jgi:glyoxylase I family protein
MAKITGIGGLFFRARDPAALAAWYEKHLSIGSPQTTIWRQEGGVTVFAPFAQDTDYFGRPEQQWMVNFRVDDLDTMMAKLKASGIAVETRRMGFRSRPHPRSGGQSDRAVGAGKINSEMRMTKTSEGHDQALAIFHKQLDCLIRDDKVEQMKLYAEDLVYEFPFASDRPRRIEGKAAFLAVMTPLWAAVRQRDFKGIKTSRQEFHATDKAGLYIARFTLDVSAGGKVVPIEFVQFLHIRDGLIVAAQEYFNPQARSEIAS